MVWHTLIADAMAGSASASGYSYVYVHRNVPQTLTLWNAGRTVRDLPRQHRLLRRRTELGTFPVFEHIPVGTMSGTNPDGSHYNDPGIHWISYFNGGDALHAFNRASFGTPQSLGCVELPLAAAAGLAVHADRHARHDRDLSASRWVTKAGTTEVDPGLYTPRD